MNDDLRKVKETVIRGEGSDTIYNEDQLFIINYTGVAGVIARSADEAAKKFQASDILGKTEAQEISMSDHNEDFQNFLHETGHDGHEHSIRNVHDGEIAIPLGPSKSRGNKSLQN